LLHSLELAVEGAVLDVIDAAKAGDGAGDFEQAVIVL